jgi:hypothetical protein
MNQMPSLPDFPEESQLNEAVADNKHSPPPHLLSQLVAA